MRVADWLQLCICICNVARNAVAMGKRQWSPGVHEVSIIEVVAFSLSAALVVINTTVASARDGAATKLSYQCNILLIWVTLLVGHFTSLAMTIFGDWGANVYPQPGRVDQAFAPHHVFNYGHLLLGAVSWASVGILEARAGERVLCFGPRPHLRYACFYVAAWNYFAYDTKHRYFSDGFSNLFIEYMMAAQLAYNVVRCARQKILDTCHVEMDGVDGEMIETDDVGWWTVLLTTLPMGCLAVYKCFTMVEAIALL